MNGLKSLRGMSLSPEKQKEYEELARGAGGGQFPGITSQIKSPEEIQRLKDLSRQELEMNEQGYTSYDAPITGDVDMDKIRMADPKFRAQQETNQEQRWMQPEPIQAEPSRQQVEEYMRESGARPSINESDERFYNRIKKMISER